MSKTKAFFHDRLLLLILSINTFLTIVLIVTALLPLTDPGSGYIKEYRSNLGLDGYFAGEVFDIVSFAIFAAIVYIFQIVVGIRVYHIHRSFSMVVLLMTMIILIFGLLSSMALLSLS